jgi:formylglycine-generating enzyme required for sulfatase activity
MASPRATQRQQPAEAWRILRWRSRHWAHREPLAQGVALTMLRIPAGSFEMGAPETEADSSERERPVHRVRLGEFLLGQTPITQAQWRAVAAWQRQEHEDAKRWPEEPLDPDPVAKLDDAERFLGEERPVLNVSWMQAEVFCGRLALRTGKNYTLPSEAQWEYACRAGTTTPFHYGETLSDELANYNANFTYGRGREGQYRQETTEVGSFPANAWGLHDMHGNVCEWCADHWHSSYNLGQQKAPSDGSPWLDAAEEGKKGEDGAQYDNRSRVLRGGSWYYNPVACRSACRLYNHPAVAVSTIGFRVCCLPRGRFSSALKPSSP